MANLNIQSQHLVELSDEQQELVSGGLAIFENVFSNFQSDNELAVLNTKQSSGPNGTTIEGTLAVANLETFTSGARQLAVNTDLGGLLS